MGLGLAAARWLTDAAALWLIGGAGVQLLSRRAVAAGSLALGTSIDGRVARLVVGGAVCWVAACAATLAAQVDAWFGADGFASTRPVIVMLTQTVWGHAWAHEAGAAAGAVLLSCLAYGWPRVRGLSPLAIGTAVILTVPWTGHGAGHGRMVGWIHAVHLLGAGLWLGTLAMVSVATWPLWRRRSPSSHALRALLTSFTPIALAGAALVAGSGIVLTVDHVRPLSGLLTSTYGRVLVSKVVVAMVVAGIGWRNWRRLRPRIDDDASRGQLRAATIAELILAFALVLSLTAWLSGLPMPMLA